MASVAVLAVDFDGVLLDTENTAAAAWRELFARHHCRIDEAILQAAAGRRDAREVLLDALQDQRPGLDREAEHTWWLGRQVTLAAALTVPGHVRRALGRAHREGIRLAVASSATRDWVVPHLERQGIADRFEHVVCGDGRPAKPDPAVYLAVLELTGVPAAHVLAVEDSPLGVRAAHAAGIACVGLVNAVHPAAALGEADLRVRSLDELWAPAPAPVGGSEVSCAC